MYGEEISLNSSIQIIGISRLRGQRLACLGLLISSPTCNCNHVMAWS